MYFTLKADKEKFNIECESHKLSCFRLFSEIKYHLLYVLIECDKKVLTII